MDIYGSSSMITTKEYRCQTSDFSWANWIQLELWISMMHWTTLEFHLDLYHSLAFEFQLSFLNRFFKIRYRYFSRSNYDSWSMHYNLHIVNHGQFSYVIDGGEKCHITQWTRRPDNGMVPILVPNIGFKQFGEIKPNPGIKNEFSLSITMQYHCFFFASHIKAG